MVGETEWLGGRELGSCGAETQAVMPCGPGGACGEDEDGRRPLTAVKAGKNGSPSFSFSMNGAMLVADMCSTADIVPKSKLLRGGLFFLFFKLAWLGSLLTSVWSVDGPDVEVVDLNCSTAGYKSSTPALQNRLRPVGRDWR